MFGYQNIYQLLLIFLNGSSHDCTTTVGIFIINHL